jgi:hypothetical protein
VLSPSSFVAARALPALCRAPLARRRPRGALLADVVLTGARRR